MSLERAARQRALATEAGHITWTVSESGEVRDLQGWSAFTGQDDIDVDERWLDALHANDRLEAGRSWLRSLRDRAAYDAEWRIRRYDGSYRSCVVRAIPVFEGPDIRGWTAFATDITDRLRMEIEHDTQRLLRDVETGLATRALFEDRIDRAILGARRDRAPITVIIIAFGNDDDFSDLPTNTSGVPVAREIADRMSLTLRKSDTIARLTPRTFGMVLPGTDEIGATHTARKLLVALDKPYGPPESSLSIHPTAGIAIHPDHGRDADTLFHHAEAAVATALRMGSDFAVYAASARLHTTHLALSSDLRSAIEGNKLHILYRPKVDMASREIVGFEAFPAWQHPEHGFMPPDSFVPVAEFSGLINALTEWTIDAAVRDAKSWLERRLPERVCVTLSDRCLSDPHTGSMISRILDRHGISGATLQIGINESPIMENPEGTTRLCHHLKASGIDVVIVGFGSGYSSLGYLKRLHVSEMTLDRSLVRGITVEGDECAVVQAIIAAGHILGVRVSADGVDTRATWDTLRELGCDFAQGFITGEPLASLDVPPFAVSRTFRDRLQPPC